MTAIIDNGSYSLKVGFSSDEKPQIIRNLIGRPKLHGKQKTSTNIQIPDYYFGNDVIEKADMVNINTTMIDGVITNYDDMTLIWENVFKSVLKKEANEQSLIITDRVNTSKISRKKTCEILFEKLDIPSVFFSSSEILSLYASGRTSGLVLNSGHNITSCVPIYNGHIIEQNVKYTNIAGNSINNYLHILLRKLSGVTYYKNRNIYNTLSIIKHEYCHVYDAENKKDILSDRNNTVRVTLPDNKVLQLGNARYLTPELLFNPMLLGREALSVQNLLLSTINSCDTNAKSTLFQTILLCGGTTHFQGFGQRLLAEIRANLKDLNYKWNDDTKIDEPVLTQNKKTKIKIIGPSNRIITPFIGAQILSKLDSFNQNMYISKNEWEENKDRILLQKCVY